VLSRRPALGFFLFMRSRAKDSAMLIFDIIGGIFVVLFLAAAMTGIEGNEHR
jgi:hypothetical protein